jgi:hypothetical protein
MRDRGRGLLRVARWVVPEASALLVVAMVLVGAEDGPPRLRRDDVPWPFAGRGTREGATAAIFDVVGLAAADGAAACVAFGLLSLVAAAPGILALLAPWRQAK